MKYIVKKHYNTLTDKTVKCRILLIMSYFTSSLLVLLNFYIIYKIYQYFIGDGFSFLGGLFIAFSFVITIPALIFSLINIRWIVKEKKYKCVFPVIISIIGILTGFILHNATGLWIYILIFSILLLLSCFVCKKKTKINNSNISTLILAITFAISLLGIPTSLSAQTNNKIQEIYLLDNTNVFFPYIEFVSTDVKDMFNPEKSGKYPSTNLFDGSFNTCWIAGSFKTNKNNLLYVKLPTDINLDKIILNIFSGYGKSKTLYIQNARPKKIRLSVFAAYYPEGYATEVAVLYLIKKYSERNIELLDTFGVQSFPLNLNKSKLMDFHKKNMNECKSFRGDNNIKINNTAFILKIEIIDIYKGTKYDDVCISEMFFNNRFVTAYPLKYNMVKNVYIKNDNVLKADFANEKGVVIYKDTSSVFTMIDWVQNTNYAILHYVPNDAVGPGSRIEELYSLIDLKNRKVVDTEFKKCNGHSPIFGILKKENGQFYIENIDKYDIELK